MHPSSRLRTFAATLTGNLFLVAGSLVWATAALVATAIPPRGRWVQAVARGWAKGVLAASWLPLEVERPAGAPACAVYLANHQSLFDIPALLAAIPGRVRFLAKASLFRIPIFGWAMRAAGFVPVDRSDRTSAKTSFDAALARLGEGVSILVFPEETRSRDGRLLPFRRGGFLLALKSGLPAVPVGVEGTFDVQSRRSFVIRPRTIHVRFGAALDLSRASVRRLPETIETTRLEIARLARAGLAAGAAVRRGAREAGGEEVGSGA